MLILRSDYWYFAQKMGLLKQWNEWLIYPNGLNPGLPVIDCGYLIMGG